MPAKILQKFNDVRKGNNKKFLSCGGMIVASCACSLGFGVMTSLAATENSPLETLCWKSLQNQQQSSYQNQQSLEYRSSVFQNKTSSKWQRQLVMKNHETYSFLGIKNPWIGKKIFFEEARSAWSGSQKRFEGKVFPTTSFSSPSAILMPRTFASQSYPTKKFYLAPQRQGGLDHDFQKALEQKKSPVEVRAMLEKEMQ